MVSQRSAGFTLIELLVVITIMTTLLSLVAPLMVEQVDKAKAAAEYQQLEQYLADSSKVAFLKGQQVQFRFDGKQLVRYVGSAKAELTFEYLFFPQQSLSINANGFTNTLSIDVVRGKAELKLRLTEGK
ncbi:prepilin-type N-terminal cleavage/methylation domain-containing protein [Arsukibacterium perlucidum]|uniref:prepilin-type N-terminal cleavage/methylation domain-containing protein n=1 Tax=Arsukibacterium perlucidum TaxID=368811 RepID=UPI00035D23A8|nr:prepilin-type N-terminal cleavage/methylation domain-containing protein [Arsukibacterium perlucidum]